MLSTSIGLNTDTELNNIDFKNALFLNKEDAFILCKLCKNKIFNYYSIEGENLCPDCLNKNKIQIDKSSPSSRFFMSLFLGLICCVFLSVCTYYLRFLTNYEVGFTAIVVGFIIGNAIRFGSRKKGGLLWGRLRERAKSYAKALANDILR